MGEKLKDIVNKVLFFLVLGLILVWIVQTTQNNKKIARLEKKIYEQELKMDTVSASTKAYVEAMEITMNSMDSLYTLSKQTNESEISNYWNSVSDSILAANSTEFMSNWLTEFAKK